MDSNRKPLNVQLLYANRNADFPYRKELEALKKRHPEFKTDYVVSPDRIDEKTIPQCVSDMDEPVFYVSGPEPMVEALDETLKNSAFHKNGSKPISFRVITGRERLIVKYGESSTVPLKIPAPEYPVSFSWCEIHPRER